MTTQFIVNHLWPSSCFALLAGLLTFVLRKNSPKVRYRIWLSASLKFLMPFALLVSLGNGIPAVGRHPIAVRAAAIPDTLVQIAEPFSANFSATVPVRAPMPWVPIAIGVWALGFLAISLARCRGWLRIRAAQRAGTPVELPIPVRAVISSAAGEPGVVGFLRPVLILPAQLLERLNPRQLDAVLAHELSHVRRRDNFFAAVHMGVEAILWFHPLVWWIGSRMLEERELACDEEVLRMGYEPADYVEALLKVCRFYSESALPCVSGVTGADVKKRLRTILTGKLPTELNASRKVLLALAAGAVLVLPIAVGVVDAPAVNAQAPPSAPPTPANAIQGGRPAFEVASIRRCTEADFTAYLNSLGGRDGDSGPRGGGGGAKNLGGDPGMLRLVCTPLQRLIPQAFLRYPDGSPIYPNGPPVGTGPLVQGGPAWIGDRYTIIAKPETPQSMAMMAGPMLQALLEDRFKLKLHRGTKDISAYALVVAKGGARLPPPRACSAGAPPAMRVDPGQPRPCNFQTFTDAGMDAYGWGMANLATVLSSHLSRPVVDKTGVTGSYDFHLDLPLPPPPGAPGIDDPNTPDLLGNVNDAVQKLGLKLEPTKGSTEFVVIDHIERPTEN
jgi:bla regulator protein BlaR1